MFASKSGEMLKATCMKPIHSNLPTPKQIRMSDYMYKVLGKSNLLSIKVVH